MSWLASIFNLLSPDGWVASATIALVIVTGFLAFIAYMQIRTTRRQLRAYVVVDPGNAYRQSKKNSFELHPRVSNVGITPAYGIRSAIQVAVLPYPLPSITKLPMPLPNENVMMLGPGQNRFVIGSGQRLTIQKLRDVVSNKRRIYVYGRLEYFDTFQRRRWLLRSRRRYTNYCYSISWLRNRNYFWWASEPNNDAN